MQLIWAASGARSASAAEREFVLPTGAMHVVFRLGDQPLRLFADGDDCRGTIVGSSLIGGVRNAPYQKDVSQPVSTVGMMLSPGAVELISRTPARVLAGGHTKLEDLWPSTALTELRERLERVEVGESQLSVLETSLIRFLPDTPCRHPLIPYALEQFQRRSSIADVVAKSGYSYRQFVRIFDEAIGLTPKTYCRIVRFNRVLDLINGNSNAGWADIAAEEGYADQAHLSRDFKEFSGVTPGAYRRIAPAAARHVPILPAISSSQHSSRRGTRSPA